MIIYALSDIHGFLPEVPECDICIIAGDFCPKFSHNIVMQHCWLDTNFRTWLERIPAKHIIGIAGNHDLIYEYQPTFVPKGLNWNYLQDDSITIDGIKIHGTPYQTKFGNWPFMKTEEELEVLWKDMPTCDILVVHGPPFGAGDLAIREEVNILTREKEIVRNRAGSTTLVKKLEELKIPWCICGHIHENYGIYELGTTKVANVAVCSNDCKKINFPPMLIPF